MTAGLHDAWRWGVSLRQGVAGYFPPAFSAPKTLDILYYSLAPWDATTYGKEYLSFEQGEVLEFNSQLYDGWRWGSVNTSGCRGLLPTLVRGFG